MVDCGDTLEKAKFKLSALAFLIEGQGGEMANVSFIMQDILEDLEIVHKAILKMIKVLKKHKNL